ncbi:hypothetical protein ACQPZ2_36810 [Nocardia pseudovaccinii]|uniref:hypothetical protein n=1 Tax=Nocardia pseudovaccinii TaxID=189540 RepID=UPI003D9481A4
MRRRRGKGWRRRCSPSTGSGWTKDEGLFIAGYAIAAVLTVLAALDLAGIGTGRVLSWVVEPLVLLGVGWVTTMQVFAMRMTVSAFAKLDDPRVRGLDIRTVLQAAVDALPSWCRPAIVARWLLATVGSLAVIVLLTLPSADRYF